MRSGTAHLYAVVVGHQVAHLHLHLWPRYWVGGTSTRSTATTSGPTRPSATRRPFAATYKQLRDALKRQPAARRAQPRRWRSSGGRQALRGRTAEWQALADLLVERQRRGHLVYETGRT